MDSEGQVFEFILTEMLLSYCTTDGFSLFTASAQKFLPLIKSFIHARSVRQSQSPVSEHAPQPIQASRSARGFGTLTDSNASSFHPLGCEFVGFAGRYASFAGWRVPMQTLIVFAIITSGLCRRMPQKGCFCSDPGPRLSKTGLRLP